MTFPPYLKLRADGVLLHVKVQPRATRTKIGEAHGDLLRIYVTAPPVDAAANRAVIELLSEALHRPRSAIELLKGQASRQKLLLVRGADPAEVIASLDKARLAK